MEKGNKINLNKKTKRYVTIATGFAAFAIAACVIVTIIQRGKFGDVADNEPINEKFSFLVEEECEELVNNDLQKEQYDKYNKILKEFRKGNYTLDNPYIVVDPYDLSPQTALVMFNTKKKTSVDVTIKGKNNDDFTVSFEASKEHILPIYGLYGKYNNQVELKTSDGKKNTISIEILTVGNTPEVEVIENKIKNSNGEFYFATSSLGLPTTAYDNYGELRWYLSSGYTKGITMLSNGHILLSNVAPGDDVTSTSGVIEMDMLGYIYNEFELKGGYHHDGVELDNGKLLMLTSDVDSGHIADHIALLNPKNGKIEKEWNLRKSAQKIDPNLIGDNEITWGWINSIAYDKKNNTLVLSARNNNSIVGMDYDTGDIKWILGEEKYWSSKFRDLFIKGTGTGFIYPAGSHSVSVLDDGKISIFNNGYNAFHEDTTPCNYLKNNESYAMVYSIDYNKKTASVEWKYGGQEYFSYALSSFTYTPDNHKLFNSGWHFTDKAYANPNCDIFSNAYYDAYYIEFDEKDNIIFKMHLNESKFEAVKAPIYNLEYSSVNSKVVKVHPNYEVEPGRFVTSKKLDEFDLLPEEEALTYKDNSSAYVPADYFNDRIALRVDVKYSKEVQIVFISPSGKSYRKYLKTKDQSEGFDSLLVTNLPKGRYYVYINMDGIIFNTKQYIVRD